MKDNFHIAIGFWSTPLPWMDGKPLASKDVERWNIYMHIAQSYKMIISLLKFNIGNIFSAYLSAIMVFNFL